MTVPAVGSNVGLIITNENDLLIFFTLTTGYRIVTGCNFMPTLKRDANNINCMILYKANKWIPFDINN